MLPKPHPAVVFRAVSDGAVLLHTKDEVYFGLNTVGCQIWQLLESGCADVDAMCAALVRHYPDVDAGALRQDIGELLDQLTESQLVVPAA